MRPEMWVSWSCLYVLLEDLVREKQRENRIRQFFIIIKVKLCREVW